MISRETMNNYCGTELQFLEPSKYDIAITGLVETIYGTWTTVYDINRLSILGFTSDIPDNVVLLDTLGIEEYDEDNRFIAESTFPYLPFLNFNYDSAIVGQTITTDGIESICYSREKIIDIVKNKPEPLEFFYFRIHSEFMGDNTPLFLVTLNEIENVD
jgi:hypothetical protein